MRSGSRADRVAPASPDFERLGDLMTAPGAPQAGRGAGTMPAPGVAPGGAGARTAPAREALAPPSPVSARGSRSGPSCSGLPSVDLGRQLAAIWPEVVGPEVAANARPVQLRQGRLVVTASSSAWAQTLQLMSEAIVARLDERLGAGVVERAVFRHAGWEDEKTGTQTPRGVSSATVAGTTSGFAMSPGVGATAVSGPPSDLPGPLSEEQELALAAVERLGVAPDLREKMIRAMRAAFVRAQQDPVR